MSSLSSEIAGAMEEGDLQISGANNKTIPKIIPSDSITLSQRMISACLGSFVTSLVVTPFDVIRIRIQQQQILPMQCCDNPLSTGSNLTLPDVQFSSKRNITQNTLVPNDRLFWQSHHYCESAENCAKITSTWQGFKAISRSEGTASLWRGLLLTLFQSIPLNIIYFTGYEYIRDNSPIKDHFLNPLLCGAGARTLSATLVSPIELVKTRLQSIPLDSKSAKPKILVNLLHDMSLVVKQRGLLTLFTGLQLTLWRDVPFLGVYWLFYESFKEKIGKVMEADIFKSDIPTTSVSSSNLPAASGFSFDSEDWKIFVTSFLAGSFAGTIAAVVTHPFDVGKTRLQIASESSTAKKPLIASYLFTIYRNEGVSALYAGITPRVMKIAPACAIMISSYEIGKKFFKNGNSVTKL